MSKVIQSFIHLVLHRGLEVISKDLFLFKLIPRAINISHGVIPRCSGTFSSRLFFRKKSLTKETSKKFELKVNSNSNFDYYLNRNKFVRLVGYATTFSFILLVALSVFPIINHEESVEATYTPANPPTVTITSSSNIASVDITPTSSDGTFASSTSASEVAFGVTTDNLTGYTVAVSARSGDTLGQLTNASYGDTLDTISTITSETDFSTNSTYTNQWGIKPSKYVDTSTGTVIDNTSSTINYLPAPTTSELVLDTTNTPNPTTANNYTIGLGARVDYTKPVGTYTNTYVLQAVGNQISYQINYRDNSSGSDVVWNTEGTSNITASSFTLLSTSPTRTGYDFVGWCYGTVNHTTNPSTCTGTVYQPGETFTFSSLSTTTTNTANIYAMWKLYIQNFTKAMCQAQASSAAKIVIDRRDEKAYTVKKLADGNCWLLENLRLDLSTVSLSALQGTTSAPNTNATNQILTYLKNGGGTSPYPTSGVVAKTASGGSWGDSYNLPYIHTAYENTIQAASGSAPAGKIGIYYNYCAASAGSYCYASGAATGNASYDICPSGWHMPTGGSSGQYQNLYTTYSSNVANFEIALNTPLSGYISASGWPDLQGSRGLFWSPTRDTGFDMYNLYVTASATAQDRQNRRCGFSVRCVRSS